MLSDTQVERYSRQIVLPQVGGRGQVALLSATVTIHGSSDLAEMAALYLAAAGVGHLRVSRPTAAAIEGLNPDCHLAVEEGRDPAIDGVRSGVVLCADAGADTCAAVNAACIAVHVPMIFGDAAAAVGRMGVCAGFEPHAPCYMCLSRSMGSASGSGAAPAPVNPFGNMTAGFIGTLLATEAMIILLRVRPSLTGRLVTFDALAGEVYDVPAPKDPRCTACGGVHD